MPALILAMVVTFCAAILLAASVLLLVHGGRRKQPKHETFDDPGWPRYMAISVKAIEWEEDWVVFGEIDPEPEQSSSQPEGQDESGAGDIPPWISLDPAQDPQYPVHVTLSYGNLELGTYVKVARYELSPGRVLFTLDEEARSWVYGVEQIEVTFPVELVPDLRPLEAVLRDILTFRCEPFDESLPPVLDRTRRQ